MAKQFHNQIATCVLVAVAAFAFLQRAQASPSAGTEPTALAEKKGMHSRRVVAKSGNAYRLFDDSGLVADFVTMRPDRKDKRILLCIPAAFTDKIGKVDGIYVSNGVIGHKNAASDKFGGAMMIENGDFRIIATDRGAQLTPEFADEVGRSKGCMFQQFQVVRDGAQETYKDKTEFQRRAFVVFSNGKKAVAESVNAITLSQLSVDLVDLGVANALNADMGAWDEGWYRDVRGKLIVLGRDRSATRRQSNWFTLSLPPTPDSKKP